MNSSQSSKEEVSAHNHTTSHLATARRPPGDIGEAQQECRGEGDKFCQEGGRSGCEAPKDEQGQRDRSRGVSSMSEKQQAERERCSMPETKRPWLLCTPEIKHPHGRARPATPAPRGLLKGMARLSAPVPVPCPRPESPSCLPLRRPPLALLMGLRRLPGGAHRSLLDAPIPGSLARQCFHYVFTCMPVSRTSLRLSQRQPAFT